MKIRFEIIENYKSTEDKMKINYLKKLTTIINKTVKRSNE